MAWRRGGAAVTVALAGWLLAGCGSATPVAGRYAGHTIDLGAVLSLSGAAAPYGSGSERGARLAVDAIDSAGGVLGARLRLDVADDGSDPARAAAATDRLITAGRVVALLGPTLSNSAPSAHPVAARLHTPMLAVSNTGAGIVGPGCSYCGGWIFRDSLGEATAFPVNIDVYAAAAHPHTAVLLYPPDDKFSADSAAVVRRAAPAAGIQLLGSVEFAKATADLRPFVSAAVAEHPDVIFITSFGALVPRLMVEARALGFTGQFLGGNGLNAPDISEQAGAAGAGARSATAWYLGSGSAANTRFVAAFRARYGADPDQFAAQAYTGVMVIADAARRAGLSFSDLAGDRARLRGAMQSTTVDSPMGSFRFTADHDVSQTVWIVAMDGRGGYTLLTSRPPPGSGSG